MLRSLVTGAAGQSNLPSRGVSSFTRGLVSVQSEERYGHREHCGHTLRKEVLHNIFQNMLSLPAGLLSKYSCFFNLSENKFYGTLCCLLCFLSFALRGRGIESAWATDDGTKLPWTICERELRDDLPLLLNPRVQRLHLQIPSCVGRQDSSEEDANDEESVNVAEVQM